MTQTTTGAESPKIVPFLWFNDQAGEAMEFYTSLVPNSRIVSLNRAGERVMSGTFVMDGRTYHAFNGGPHFRFNEAVSLMISCETQAEVDRYWTALTSNGGEESRCGWCKDRFGLSWQVTPRVLLPLLQHPDRAKAARVQQAMLGMNKLDIAALENA